MLWPTSPTRTNVGLVIRGIVWGVMPDWDYRKDFSFVGGTPGKGQGSLWKCCWCEKIVCASWGHAAKHWKKCGAKKMRGQG